MPRYDDVVAAPKPKPKQDMGERVAIPLDPEQAIRALLKVNPEAPPADGDTVDEVGRRSFPTSDPPSSSRAGPENS